MFIIKNTLQKLFTNPLIRSPIAGIVCGGNGGGGAQINATQIRTKVIYHLPRPTEVKRVRKQGFKKRLSTPGGKLVLMNRILAGEKVISQ